MSGLISLGYARTRARLGARATLGTAFAMLGGGLLVVAMSNGYALVLLAMAIAGIGVGLLMPHVNTWLSELAPRQRRGQLLGLLTAAIFSGQFLSPLVAQPLTQAFGLAATVAIMGVSGLALGAVAVIWGIGYEQSRATSKPRPS